MRPSAKTDAHRFENSSLFIADACEFRIIHVLQTPAVSSIISLDWHSKSRKLAVQAASGRLDVWNVKRNRIKSTLRKGDDRIDGPLWRVGLGPRYRSVWTVGLRCHYQSRFGKANTPCSEVAVWEVEDGSCRRLSLDSRIKGWAVASSTATLLAVGADDKMRSVDIGL